MVIATEQVTVGTSEDGTFASFAAILACPAVCFNPQSVLKACGESQELAVGVSTYLAARDLSKLHAEATSAGGKILVKVDGMKVNLEVGKDVFFTAAASAAAAQ